MESSSLLPIREAAVPSAGATASTGRAVLARQCIPDGFTWTSAVHLLGGTLTDQGCAASTAVEAKLLGRCAGPPTLGVDVYSALFTAATGHNSPPPVKSSDPAVQKVADCLRDDRVAEAVSAAVQAYNQSAPRAFHYWDSVLEHGLVVGTAMRCPVLPFQHPANFLQGLSGIGQVGAAQRRVSVGMPGVLARIQGQLRQSGVSRPDLPEATAQFLSSGAEAWVQILLDSGCLFPSGAGAPSIFMIALRESWVFLCSVSEFLAEAFALVTGTHGSVLDADVRKLDIVARESVLGLRMTYLDMALHRLCKGGLDNVQHPLRYRAVPHAIFARSIPTNRVRRGLKAYSAAGYFEMSLLVGASASQLCEFVDGLVDVVRNRLLVSADDLADQALMALVIVGFVRRGNGAVPAGTVLPGVGKPPSAHRHSGGAR